MQVIITNGEKIILHGLFDNQLSHIIIDGNPLIIQGGDQVILIYFGEIEDELHQYEEKVLVMMDGIFQVHMSGMRCVKL